MVLNKKAISPVVATALLLVVAVVAVVGFQTWFNGFSSGQYADIESKSNTGSEITIEYLDTNNLYIKNSGNDNISTIKTTIDEVKCPLISDGVNIVPGVSAYNITNCSKDAGTTVKVVVATEKGVFHATEIVK